MHASECLYISDFMLGLKNMFDLRQISTNDNSS